jgi:hypothetical protein
VKVAPGDDRVLQIKKYYVSIDDITNPSLEFWVHHAAYILPQGRNVWWNPLRVDRRPRRSRVNPETSDEEEESDYDEYEGEFFV